MSRRDLSIALLAAVLLGGLLAIKPLPALSGLSLDILLNIKRTAMPAPPAPGRVAIILIDEKSTQIPSLKDKPQILWSPAFTKVMGALSDAGARVIGLDYVMAASVEPTLLNFDLAFRQKSRALAREGRLVLGKFQGTSSATPIVPHFALTRATGDANIRAVNVSTDQDGVVRSVQRAFETSDGRTELSFSGALAARAGAYDAGSITDVRARLLDWRATQTMDIFAFGDVLNCAQNGYGDDLRARFDGRVVIIGSALDDQDRLRTPLRLMGDQLDIASPCELVSPRAVTIQPNQMPGVLTQGLATATWLAGSAPRTPNIWLNFLLLSGLGLVGIAATRTPRIGAAAALGASVLIWSVVCVGALAINLMLPWLDGIASLGLGWSGLLAISLSVARRKERLAREAFSRFHSPSIVRQFLAQEKLPALGGERCTLTILMTDLANYTSYTEVHAPEAVVTLLNQYFAIVVEEVEKRNGFVAQFAGDAAVCYFGAPVYVSGHARKAVEASAAIVLRMRALVGDGPETGASPIVVRCGIETGDMVLGNIGAEHRLNYAAVGPAINRTQRLQEAGKALGVPIVLGQTCYDQCDSVPEIEDGGEIRVRGVDAPIKVYTLDPSPQKFPHLCEPNYTKTSHMGPNSETS